MTFESSEPTPAPTETAPYMDSVQKTHILNRHETPKEILESSDQDLDNFIVDHNYNPKLLKIPTLRQDKLSKPGIDIK